MILGFQVVRRSPRDEASHHSHNKTFLAPPLPVVEYSCHIPRAGEIDNDDHSGEELLEDDDDSVELVQYEHIVSLIHSLFLITHFDIDADSSHPSTRCHTLALGVGDPDHLEIRFIRASGRVMIAKE